MTQLTKRTALDQIRHVLAYQASVVEIMREKRSSYLMLQHFNQIKKLRDSNHLHS